MSHAYFVTFCILINLTLIILKPLSAQDGLTLADRDNIRTVVQQIFGEKYTLSSITKVDSAIGNLYVENGRIEDPYGTLHGCMIFTAKGKQKYLSPPKGAIGIYKNGQVIWHSDTLISDYNISTAYTYATRDLNNDGNVEIITTWNYSSRNGPMYLWIFSWDGQTGNLINEINKEDELNLNQSVIYSDELADFDILDVNGDGIMEIRGYPLDPNADPNIYSWNGSLYGKWPDTPQPPTNELLPRNKIDVELNSKIKKKDEKYQYQYTVQSEMSSIQDINQIILECQIDSVQKSYSRKNWKFRLSDNLIDWTSAQFPPYGNFILPGETDSSFGYISYGLPKIFSFYIRGYNGGQSSFQDYKENSFHSETIGAAILLDPFISMDFIDSLINNIGKSYEIGWISDSVAANKYNNYLENVHKYLNQNQKLSGLETLDSVLRDVDIDSITSLSSEAYALIKFNTEYLKEQLAQSSGGPTNYNVILKNSQGSLLTGGSLQYYEGGWKNAINNGDGTFKVNTDKSTINLRMTYAYGNQTISNVSVNDSVITFQTIPARVELQNSSGTLIDEGTVQYYSGGWREFGVTSGGVAATELLPKNYNFRMSYASASNDKQQDISADPTVVFQTVPARVELQNSSGTLMDEGTVQYYSSGWREFGVTSDGVAVKELLPKNYNFRMSFAYASIDKQQDITTDPTVVFQTVPARVELQNSSGELIDEGMVKYYSGGWREFGVTYGGVAARELLPKNYNFRMSFAFASNDKQQDISSDQTIVFSTVLATINVTNQVGQPVNDAQTKYYSGGWRTIGTTVNGAISIELLPKSYSFRAIYSGTSNDKQQDISSDPVVNIQLGL